MAETLESLGVHEALILDDRADEISLLQNALKGEAIETEFFKVDIFNQSLETHSVTGIPLVFLDLHYGYAFDAEMCAQFVDTLLPDGAEYFLIIWSGAAALQENAEAVLQVLQGIDRMPKKYLIREKNSYLIGGDKFAITKLLSDIFNELTGIIETVSFVGEILHIEEGIVIVDCLLDKESKSFEKRSFDKRALEGAVRLIPDNLIKIDVTLQKGCIKFEFSDCQEDISELRALFNTDNFLEGIDLSIFRGKDSEEDDISTSNSGE